ncbi:MAG: hypothetical protein R8P61_05755 [Bacteroidia bacterium]|nr:hypothetical protein [Bacteroidia bacterium]
MNSTGSSATKPALIGCCNSKTFPCGYEYKSNAHLWGIPLLHISFKYEGRKKPVPAKGIIAIGQYAVGVVNIGQFGVGLFSIAQFSLSMFSVGQFAIATYAISQFAIAREGIAQFGLFLSSFF